MWSHMKSCRPSFLIDSQKRFELCEIGSCTDVVVGGQLCHLATWQVCAVLDGCKCTDAPSTWQPSPQNAKQGCSPCNAVVHVNNINMHGAWSQ